MCLMMKFYLHTAGFALNFILFLGLKLSVMFSCFVLMIHLMLFISGFFLSVSTETLRLLLKISPGGTLQVNPLTCYSKCMD